MKKIAILLLSFGLIIPAISQVDSKAEALANIPDMKITSGNLKVNKSSQPAMVAEIAADDGDIIKAWKKLVEDKCACDFKKDKGLYQSVGIKLPEITAETISIYSDVGNNGSVSTLKVAIDLGGAFVDDRNYKTEAANLENMMMTFVKQFYSDLYDGVIKGQEKALEKEVRAHEKLIKEGEKLVKNIDGAKNDIAKAENNIVKSEEQIKNLEQKIVDLKAEIENKKQEIVDLEKATEDNAKAVEKQKGNVDAQQKVVDNLKTNAAAVKSK